MKTASVLTPTLRQLFSVVLVALFSVAPAQSASFPPTAQGAPAATTAQNGPPTLPASAAIPNPVTGAHPTIPQTPWFGEKTLPANDELSLLQSARGAAERDPEVVIAMRDYAARYSAANDLVRTLMFSNPAIKDPDFEKYLSRYKIGQVLHETFWNIGLDNSLDFLLPDPVPNQPGNSLYIGQNSSGTPSPRRPLAEVLPAYQRSAQNAKDPAEKARIEASMQGLRALYGLDEIHQTALSDKDSKIALQKVRDAYKTLDDAVRAAMRKNPTVKILIEKYAFLLYGRRDLGLRVVSGSEMM